MSRLTVSVPGYQCSSIVETALVGAVRVTLASVGPSSSGPAHFRVFSHPDVGRPDAITDRRDPFTGRGERTARAAFASLVSSLRRRAADCQVQA